MADPRIPPTAPLGAPPHTTPGPNPTYPTNTTTTHIHETKPTNWFAYLLGGAVVAVGIAALLLSGNDTPTPQSATGNNVTIEAPAAAPEGGPVSPTPDATAPAVTPDATAPAVTPDATAPDATAPAPADPVAPAPDAGAPAPAPAN